MRLDIPVGDTAHVHTLRTWADSRALIERAVKARRAVVIGASRFRGRRAVGKVKDLIAVAVALVTQCPYCIRGHTASALRKGATHQEVMEAIWVAAEMRAGAGAHSNLALETMNQVTAKQGNKA